MELGLNRKYALVTGGSHGIGRAVALALAEEGCNVAIFARTRSRLEEVKREIGAFGVEAEAYSGDGTHAADIDGFFRWLGDFWGRLDILVNCIGGGGRWGKTALDTPEETWVEVYEKNVLAAIRFTLRTLPLMVNQRWGRVVTIASIYGREVGSAKPWFSVAKAAEIMLMKTLARDYDLARKRITLNTVAPGPIMIEGTGWDEEVKRDPLGFQDMLLRDFPQRRLGRPEEVAHLVVFLCSEKAGHINGACIPIDGGYGRAT